MSQGLIALLKKQVGEIKSILMPYPLISGNWYKLAQKKSSW